ncbi:HU family DNA-binding protein [Fusobacterium sp. THCT1E2]
MTEKEFLTLYKERRNLKSIREAKERLDSLWKALFDVLEEEEKVIIKDWGIFEKKEVKPRKILNLATKQMMITEEKKVIKFKPRMKMIDKVNELNTLIEEEYEH